MNKQPELIDIPLYQDDRGAVCCPMDCLDAKQIKRTYIVENHARGQVRAWHLHQTAGTYFFVLEGVIKAAAYGYFDANLEVVTLSARKPQLFYIPPGYYNGHMSLTDSTKVLVYSELSFDEVKDDDERLEVGKGPANVWSVEHR